MNKAGSLLWLSFCCLATGYLLLCAWLYFSQRSLIYFPTEAQGSAEQASFERQGEQIRYSQVQRAGISAVLYFGGNAEDVSLSLIELAAAFPAASVYALHYRGYGGSSGSASEQALVADALMLFDQLSLRHPDMVLVGRSLGSGVAIQVAAQRPIKHLVLVTPFNSLVDVAAAHFPYFPVGLLLEDRFESQRYAPNLRVATTIIAASDDRIIPAWSTQKLADALGPAVSEFVLLEGFDHNDISASPRYWQALAGRLPSTQSNTIED